MSRGIKQVCLDTIWSYKGLVSKKQYAYGICYGYTIDMSGLPYMYTQSQPLRDRL